MKSGLKYILFTVSAVALVAVAVAAYRHLSAVTPAPSAPSDKRDLAVIRR